jgi:uncharacterized protein
MVTKRGRKWMGRGTLLTVIVLVGTLGASTWVLSGTVAAHLLLPPGPSAGVEVFAVDATSVTITKDDRTLRPGIWGLLTAGGEAVVGAVEGQDDTSVRRQLLSSSGPVTLGVGAAWVHTAFGPDPSGAGVAYSEVILEGPVGDLPTWVTAGDDDTWVVFVHDFASDRTESLRVIGVLADLGLRVVVPTLRTDDRSGDGRSDLGNTVWRDVLAAVDFALASGAHEVVLFGSGTGASASLLAAQDTRYAPRIAAFVFDAPLLDPAAVADTRLAEDKVPGFLMAWAKAAASFRFGIDWNGLDHLAVASSVVRPVLVLQGDADARAPVEVSRRYVETARHASLVEIPGAGHGEAWNLDPAGYDGALAAFLQATVVEPPATPPEG